MFIDYEILKLIWWLFIGVLLAGFAVMDGQDMGVGTLLPFIGKNDDERPYPDRKSKRLNSTHCP